MRLIMQPKKSNLCGQTCVAMIANISLEESIKAFGTRGCTRTKQVAAVLRELGVKCGDKLIRLKNEYDKPLICMVKLHFDWDKHTHWTVWYKDKFYDPSIGVLEKYNKGVRQTSYLPIEF